MDALTLYLQQFLEVHVTRENARPYKTTDILADFHLLKYLLSNGIYTLTIVRYSSL